MSYDNGTQCIREVSRLQGQCNNFHQGHKVRLIDRFANNELIQKNISACSSEPNANYAYVPLKEPATFRRASDLQSSKTPEVYPLLEERMRLGDWAQLFLVFDDIDLFQVRT